MTRVGWLADVPDVIGGAGPTQREFRAAAPADVDVVPCPVEGTWAPCDIYVVHNCVQYLEEALRPLEGQRVIKFWHDVGPHLQPGVPEWLGRHSTPICCSPIQAAAMGLPDAALIPPPVDLRRFAAAAELRNGDRSGRVSIGSWRNYGKAPHRVAEWGAVNGGVEFYGGGIFAPPGSAEVPQEEMPDLLASYETFVYLPAVLEPFGRLVAEAWAAGCEIVTNDLVGAKWWTTERPAALETAAAGFWRIILA